MIIEKDKVVSIAYTLKNAKGEQIDAADEKNPLDYIHGEGYIIPGLEKQLEGKTVGDKVSAVVPPEEAYGIRDENFLVEIPREQFSIDGEIEVGMQFEAAGPEGVHLVTVTKVENDMITVDGNHPLAGETLYFDVTIVNIREATEEELAARSSGCGCGGCGGSCGDDCNCGGDCGSGCGGCN